MHITAYQQLEWHQSRGRFRKFAIKVIEWIRNSLALGRNEVSILYYFLMFVSPYVIGDIFTSVFSLFVCFFCSIHNLIYYTSFDVCRFHQINKSAELNTLLYNVISTVNRVFLLLTRRIDESWYSWVAPKLERNENPQQNEMFASESGEKDTENGKGWKNIDEHCAVHTRLYMENISYLYSAYKACFRLRIGYFFEWISS